MKILQIIKRNKNQNNNLNKQILNKIRIILSRDNIDNNKSDSYKIKQKRIKDNYSYYFKLKEKAKK